MCLDIYYSLYTNTFTCANLFLHVCASCEGCSSTRRVSKQCFVMELFLFLFWFLDLLYFSFLCYKL